MAPKKKKKGKASGGSEKGNDREKDAEREEQLDREYETLTETLSNLKRRADHLQRDNKALQNEVKQIRMESQEYISYMSKQMQKHQNAGVTLSDQMQQKLEELNKQKKEMVEKHEELVNGLKKEILEKETELAQLKLEITELGDVKSLQQQQLDRIAELEQEEEATCYQQAETLHALKAKSLREEEQRKAASKRTVRERSLTANKEAPPEMLIFMQQLTEENFRLYEELRKLVQRTRALRSHQKLLQSQRRQLLLEEEFVQELQRLHYTRSCQHRSSCCQLTDPEFLDNKTCFD